MYRIKHFVCFPLTVFAIQYGIAENTGNAIKWDADHPETKIEARGRFSKLRDPRQKNNTAAPADSSARILAVDGYCFQWRPNWSFVGLGGALLPFACQSPDQSVLGIVETLPQKNAPESSIIVFLNLYDLRIINYTVMPGMDVRRFCFIPNSRELICLVKQPFNKYYPTPKYRLVKVDSRTAEINSASAIFEGEITALCCSPDGDRVFTVCKNSDMLRIYGREDLKRAFTTVKTVKSPLFLNCSADGRRLAVTGSDEIRIYLLEQPLIPEKTIKLPAHYHPDKTVLCSDDASALLLSRLGDDTYYYDG
ncbi:MAG: hypothetical protein PHV59_00825, partial [Victivallales bacterium]|nr:hypothetical protein [Victivallales bacterium]